MKILYYSIVLFCFAFIFPQNGKAQNSLDKKSEAISNGTSQEDTANLITLCKEVENTYQVIVSDPRLKIALTSDVCEIVKRERKKSETVFYTMDKFVTLKIYSLDELKNISKPLPLIIYNQ